MTRVAAAAALAALAACWGSGATDPAHARPTTGGILGIAFDHDTGYAIDGAQVRASGAGSALPVLAVSAGGGLFELSNLPPGRYALRGELHGQTVDEPNIDVDAGEVTFAKLAFTPAHPDAPVAQGTATLSEITRYQPADADHASGRIEGFVIQPSTHAAVGGAVVMAVRAGDASQAAVQTASDDRGAYRFDGLAPGIYVVSAYYSVGQRGQIEVRRGDVEVRAGDAVVVPLIVDLSR
jgi:hypothetical protein|nr:carboxypeptidase-like regulatory domain-containing protein [Kofleriaceae bacterium]